MKKLLIILFMFLTVGVFGQNTFKYEIKANGGLSIGGGEKIDSAKVVAGVLVFYRNGDSLIVAPSTGGGGPTMVYPGAGIPLSTGTAWGTSITNNSANWNTAYGWGNHAGLYDATGTASGLISTHQSTYNHTNYNTAYSDRLKWDGGSTDLVAATGRTSLGGTTIGQAFFTMSNPASVVFFRGNADNTVTALSAANFKTALTLTSSDVGLGNVTNESKTTMFTSPTFTGTITLPATTSIGSVSDTEIGYVNGTTGVIQTQIDSKIAKADSSSTLGKKYATGLMLSTGLGLKVNVSDTLAMLSNYINKSDTAAMLSKYLLISDTVGLGGSTSGIQASDTSLMLDPYITDIEARKAINDSLTVRLNGATELSDVAVMKADSTAGAGHYASNYDMTTGLAGKVAVSDTAAMLADYINKADTSAMLTDYINKADTSTMLTPYARKKSPTFNTIVKLDSDTLATRAYARSYGGTETVAIDDVHQAIADSAVKLSDIRPYFVFGKGTGQPADSTLFAKGDKSFGSFRVIEDSLYVHSLTNIYMTSGDSLRFNVYYGNGMTRVATDSLFTAPQGAGSYALQTFTPDNERTINHDQDVWVGIIGPQPANTRPKEWVLQLNAKIVRD